MARARWQRSRCERLARWWQQTWWRVNPLTPCGWTFVAQLVFWVLLVGWLLWR